MQKTILITGSTDGIGREAAREFARQGQRVLLHGRNPAKLVTAVTDITATTRAAGIDAFEVEGFEADLSNLAEVETLAQSVRERHGQLDVLINNAGVFVTSNPATSYGLDVRFVVNTIAPYLLTRELLPLLGNTGRVINLSSAAQSPVDIAALKGQTSVSDGAAYAQSKLALTMWSRSMARSTTGNGPMVVAVNPGSMLGTKMVEQAYGVAGADIRIGVDILCRAALSDEFATASGRYFDNDSGSFADPHPSALDERTCEQVVAAIEDVLTRVRDR
ncbi:MAG: SDR family NAD(P)-dependent oxidoreductase [bacterium]|nr:SDR family NAD(P)-dependent oxidoreductase [bacterium]